MQATETRADRKERYHSVLRTVAFNTSEGAGTSPNTIRLSLAAHGPYSADEVNRSIRAALENDDLLRWTNAEGRTQLTLVTVEDLRRVATYWHKRGSEENLKWVNEAIDRVREDTPFYRRHE